MTMRTSARLAGIVAASASLALAVTACAGSAGDGSEDEAAPTTVRIGYIPSPSDTAQLFAATEAGYFEDAGLHVELTPFQNGVSMSNALTGGSIDVGVMGAVIANFPAKGQGQVFVLNNIQSDTQQIWATPESGIESIEDLAGHTVATTVGSAANAMLDVSLATVGLAESDVEVVNLDMPAVTNTFVTGGVDAATIWTPFDEQVEEVAPDSNLIAVGSDVDLRLTGGWVANNDYYDANRDTLVELAHIWKRANSDLTTNTDETLVTMCGALSDTMDEAVCERVYLSTTAYTNAEWEQYYEDGTATEWIAEVQAIFEDMGVVEDATLTSADYFDPSIFLDAEGAE